MENRRVYRGVEEAALTGRWEDGHRHSGLSRALRYELRELIDMRAIASARVVALASMYGNSSADLQKGNRSYRDGVDYMYGTVPYLDGGKRGRERNNDRLARMFGRLMAKYDRLKADESGTGGDGSADPDSDGLKQ